LLHTGRGIFRDTKTKNEIEKTLINQEKYKNIEDAYKTIKSKNK